MKIAVVPENLIERILLAINLVPTPLLDTQLAFILARTVLVRTKLGIFETLTAGPLTSTEIAAHCQTNPHATVKLLNALLGVGYLRAKGERYSLAPIVRKWLLKDAPQSVYDMLMFSFTTWEMTENFESYVRSGKPLDLHETIAGEEWGFYQRAMRATMGFQAPEVVRRTPVPKGARDMLDIGGRMVTFRSPSVAATQVCGRLSSTCPRLSSTPRPSLRKKEWVTVLSIVPATQ
jgi:Dimerisation domain